MGRIVIACYRTKPGQEEALRAVVAQRVATLLTLGLVSEFPPFTAGA